MIELIRVILRDMWRGICVQREVLLNNLVAYSEFYLSY